MAGQPKSIKATAEKLCLTQAAVFSRTSNLEHAERIVVAHQSLRASMLDPSKLAGK